MLLRDEIWLERQAYEQAWLRMAMSSFAESGECIMVWYALFMLEQ